MTTQRPGSGSVPPEPASVHLISGAPRAHSEDLDRRIKRYLISMGIRTVCVVLAVIVPGPLRWVFIVGAVGLPYVAVVMANAVGERRQRPEPMIPVAVGREALTPTALTDADRASVYIPAPDPESGPDVTSTEWVNHGSSESTG